MILNPFTAAAAGLVARRRGRNGRGTQQPLASPPTRPARPDRPDRPDASIEPTRPTWDPAVWNPAVWDPALLERNAAERDAAVGARHGVIQDAPSPPVTVVPTPPAGPALVPEPAATERDDWAIAPFAVPARGARRAAVLRASDQRASAMREPLAPAGGGPAAAAGEDVTTSNAGAIRDPEVVDRIEPDAVLDRPVAASTPRVTTYAPVPFPTTTSRFAGEERPALAAVGLFALAGLLILAGVTLPWVRVRVGSTTSTLGAFDGGDGWCWIGFAVGFAALAASAFARPQLARRSIRIVAAQVVALVVALLELTMVVVRVRHTRSVDRIGAAFSATLAPGIVLVVVGAAVALAACCVLPGGDADADSVRAATWVLTAVLTLVGGGLVVQSNRLGGWFFNPEIVSDATRHRAAAIGVTVQARSAPSQRCPSFRVTISELHLTVLATAADATVFDVTIDGHLANDGTATWGRASQVLVTLYDASGAPSLVPEGVAVVAIGGAPLGEPVPPRSQANFHLASPTYRLRTEAGTGGRPTRVTAVAARDRFELVGIPRGC